MKLIASLLPLDHVKVTVSVVHLVTIFLTNIAKRVAEQLDETIVVPGTLYGTLIYYYHFPLTISLDYQATIAMADDIF